ncbi:signal peptidase I [Ascidiimonas aurantiaca]|uniref:signal peptidase I n=1 Tax=Ascidiimonas aurantiaca TaxID=1685432 RepID=UPI0030ED4C27
MELVKFFVYLIAVTGIIHGVIFWRGYVKAGRQLWEAFIPFYNIVILLKIIERPWWWVILLFVPVIGNIISVVLIYEWLHVFGYRKKRYTFYAYVTVFLFLIYVNYASSTKYLGKDNQAILKSVSGWTGAIIFAVVAATLVHNYVMQPYVIPTPSLEKTLLVGDFLFVSKFHYGARPPMTPVALPMVHDSIPLIGTRSYLSKPQLPYMRIPGFQKVKRNDIVVFNWPTDTVRFFRDRSGIHVQKPVDKRSNYVKRCVGIAGDSLELRDGYVYINGKKSELPDRAKLQFSYFAETDGSRFNANYLYTRFGVRPGDAGPTSSNTYYFRSLTEEAAERLEKNPKVSKLQRDIVPEGEYDKAIFPHSPEFPWNNDNFGPVYIPEAGKTVTINTRVLPLYRRIIEEYEGNSLEVNGNEIRINGEKATSYTFKQDYYWMMGDNRHNSEDSRFWGFVPFDHVVGKPVFIWFSWDSFAQGIGNKIRFERLFTTVGGSGKPVSYFKYFIIVLIAWFIFDFFRKKRKKA